MWPFTQDRGAYAPMASRGVTLGRVAAPARLREGWERVRRNRGGPGGDGVTIKEFGANLDQRLGRLSRELLGDRYRPGPLRAVAIPKPTGGERRLAIPCVRDRVVQSALMLLMDRAFDATMSGASFGYRQGRGVADALARVEAGLAAGGQWIVDLDIEKFFDSVPHDALMRLLLDRGVEPRAVRLVRLWLDGFSAAGKGLPQGAPISPMLANLYLDGLDWGVERRNHCLVRYADDLALLCPTRRDAAAALRRMRRELRRRGLAINGAKTRIVAPGETWCFLGAELAAGEATR